jgi:hypothetical protein
MRIYAVLTIILFLCAVSPLWADEPANPAPGGDTNQASAESTPPPAPDELAPPPIPEEKEPTPGLAVNTWQLPGKGAGPLVVNPANGLIWTFFHQTHELAAINGKTGEVAIKVPIKLAPTAIAFSADGKTGFIVGEPTGDQIIAAGLIQAFDSANGKIIGELELEGAATAVCVADPETLFVATGMQYEYAGIVYKIIWDISDRTLKIDGNVTVGKLPWAVDVYNGNLYVTDSELQWTAQPDGSEGAPWGGWVWIFEMPSLQFVNKIWVGINPSNFAITKSGLLVGCSGRKQSEGQYEPAAVLLRNADANDSEYIFTGTSGTCDLASIPSSNWAIAALVDFSSTMSGRGISAARQVFGDKIPEAKRWVYTGDVALIDLDALAKLKSEKEKPGSGIAPEEGTEPEKTIFQEIAPESITLTKNGYIRNVALSTDGKFLYALRIDEKDESESILVVPVESLRK